MGHASMEKENIKTFSTVIPMRKRGEMNYSICGRTSLVFPEAPAFTNCEEKNFAFSTDFSHIKSLQYFDSVISVIFQQKESLYRFLQYISGNVYTNIVSQRSGTEIYT